MSKILLNNIKYAVYNIIHITLHVKQVQKHILPAETAPSARFLKNPTMHTHSQHPYLLGFDSNLVPNLNILVFQPYPGEDSKYSEKSGRFACNSASSLGIPRIIRKIVSLVLFFSEDTAGSTVKSEYIEYSPYSDRKTRIFRKILCFVFSVHYRYRIHRLFARFGEKNPNNWEILQQGAVQWQKLPYQHKNFPKNRKNCCDFAH